MNQNYQPENFESLTWMQLNHKNYITHSKMPEQPSAAVKKAVKSQNAIFQNL